MNCNLLPYVAGFFDGEGHIMITSYRTKEKYLSYVLHVGVTNTNREILEQFAKVFGGRIFVKKSYSPMHRTSYRWALHCGTARDFLNKILRHLKLKKVQAELAIEFQNGIRKSTNGIPMGQKELERRNRLRDAIHSFSSRHYVKLVKRGEGGKPA